MEFNGTVENEELLDVAYEDIEEEYLDEEAEKEDKKSQESFFSNELIVSYLKDIGKIPLLTPEEEVEVAKKVRDGDKDARELMIKSNLKLVVNIAKHYKFGGIDPMDLIQEGNQGLITAVERFDVDRGYRFSTYATCWIKQAITRYVLNCGRLIRVPVHALEFYSKVNRCKKELEQKLHREPSTAEIADAMSMNEVKITRILSVTKDVKSLETPITTEDSEDSLIKDFITDENQLTPEEEYTKSELTSIIMAILNEKKPNGEDRFKEKEKEVILKRFGFMQREYTLENIGEQWGVTRERVRQVESAALKKLRLPSTAMKLKPFLTH